MNRAWYRKRIFNYPTLICDKAMSASMKQRRSHFDTIYDILKFCNPRARKLNILCRANLNHKQLERYLTVLLEHGLLEAEENGFRTTEKGSLFMRKFEELHKLMEGDG
jgi:predicted transcriptional regulator